MSKIYFQLWTVVTQDQWQILLDSSILQLMTAVFSTYVTLVYITVLVMTEDSVLRMVPGVDSLQHVQVGNNICQLSQS